MCMCTHVLISVEARAPTCVIKRKRPAVAKVRVPEKPKEKEDQERELRQKYDSHLHQGLAAITVIVTSDKSGVVLRLLKTKRAKIEAHHGIA